MRLNLNPSLPEIALVNSANSDEAIAQLVAALTPSGGGFNYLEATKCARAAYRGLHRLDLLVVGTRLNDGSVGAKANKEVALLAGGVALGRSTNLIDLSPRTFQYGAGRSASYRVPFLFVESGTVKLYFLQPRKRTVFKESQVSFLATIFKKYLLDAEFYGERTDVEFVEVAERSEGKGRETQVYRLTDLDLWEDHKIASHLSVVQEALRFIESESLVTKKRRPLKDRDLPLFD